MIEGSAPGMTGVLTIHFWCEECGERGALTIAQHKGQTLIDVVPVPASE